MIAIRFLSRCFGPVLSLAATFLCLFATPIRANNLPALNILPPDVLGWVRLNSPGQTGLVYTVDASTNLIHWSRLATLHDGISGYPDSATGMFPARFYRVSATAKTALDDWKNQIRLPEDSFLSLSGQVSGPDFRWIKFAIQLTDPFQVYYQDSQKYPFHFDFATKRLSAFQGLTPLQFDDISLRTNQQQLLLGAVLVPPYPNDAEYGIQFVGLDAYPAEFVAKFFQLVKSTIVAGSNVTAFYVPAYEQAHAAETNRSYFESKGIQLASPDRWISSDNIYAPGWALGHLKFFSGSEITTAFTDGRLKPEDILLTDGVPAEIPVLAGVLTLAPSTPNSHVAILAKSFGLPFAYISDASQREQAQRLVGKDVYLKLDPYSMEIRLVELDPTMDPAVRQQILQLKAAPALHIIPKEKYGKLTASVDNLTPADMRYFGGKASNFGFLRREIPDQSPRAIAFSFDLWDEFLDQVLSTGQSLRAEIQRRLSGYSYPPDLAALKADLADIRTLFTKMAAFTPMQKQAIIAALNGFPPGHNIRFRSSTNCEDSEFFTGAGLYDSFSGCLEDDTDDDSNGPSRCDPTESDERGVFRALQKVYASFYNDNAFIERLRHAVDEKSVGMAVLVHLSAPDETELANGVATLEATRGQGFDSLNGNLVTQKGAVSVTNPDGSAQPEVVQGYEHPFGAGGFLKERSSLVPLGGYVLEWDSDYVSLMRLFAKVADGYHNFFPGKNDFTLDFEYKKVTPGVLEVKQVREVPVNPSTNPVASFLLNETNHFRVFQGEAGDVFSNHRLKSFWSFQAKNVRLSNSNLWEGLYSRVQGEYLNGEETVRVDGPIASLPKASHSVNDDTVLDGWTDGAGASQRMLELSTEVRSSVIPPATPVFTIGDFRIGLNAFYATPQPVLGWNFDGIKAGTVTNHSVLLEIVPLLTSSDTLQKRTATNGSIRVQTEFYWSFPSESGIIQKTAPLAAWKETRITGLTTEPIILHGDYSQTYRPGHHNFTEEFIFEPTLENGLSDAIKAELIAANVRLLYVFFGLDSQQITILGMDGKFRQLVGKTL